MNFSVTDSFWVNGVSPVLIDELLILYGVVALFDGVVFADGLGFACNIVVSSGFWVIWLNFKQ